MLIDPGQTPELGWLVVSGSGPGGGGVGRIVDMGFGEPSSDAMPPAYGGRDALVCPAFTDAHFHVPQVDLVGCDGLALLDWLEQVVFPAESWWGEGGGLASARTSARRLARAGTAGVAAYLTSHGVAGREVFEFFEQKTGMRFHLGRAAMDRNAPEALVREDVERVQAMPTGSPLLSFDGTDERRRVSANPRFAVSCTGELMAEIGWELKRLDESGEKVFMQTHLSEMRPEVALVKELFPEAANYASVYDNAGLLNERSLLAHCVYLEDEEWELLAQRDCVAVHCPTANVFLNSGLFDLGAAEKHGVRVGLGSDIGGGVDIAMPRVARAMIDVAKVRGFVSEQTVRVPSPAEAWRLITEGNARLLGWEDAGVLRVGGHADVLVLRVPETWIDGHLVGRLIYNWDDSLIAQRVFNGEPVDVERIG